MDIEKRLLNKKQVRDLFGLGPMDIVRMMIPKPVINIIQSPIFFYTSIGVLSWLVVQRLIAVFTDKRIGTFTYWIGLWEEEQKKNYN